MRDELPRASHASRGASDFQRDADVDLGHVPMPQWQKEMDPSIMRERIFPPYSAFRWPASSFAVIFFGYES
jgi:hypothetical protein